MLWCPTVIHRDDRVTGPDRQLPAQAVVGVEATHDPAPAVGEERYRTRCRGIGAGFVVSGRDAVDLVFVDRCDGNLVKTGGRTVFFVGLTKFRNSEQVKGLSSAFPERAQRLASLG